MLLCCNKIKNTMTQLTAPELQQMIDEYAKIAARLIAECEIHRDIAKSETKVLQYCNYIIEVGLYTVGTNDQGRTLLQIVNTPMLFSEKAKKEILTMTFRDGAGQVVTPKVWYEREWHANRLEEKIGTLKMINAMVASLKKDLSLITVSA
jgi:hypothetical protein